MMYRRGEGVVEILLAHPGGPFWKNKDAGAWTIPKGEPADGEDLLAAAIREFKEELGVEATGPFQSLGSITQKAGKVVHAWAFEGDLNPAEIQSNFFEMEWPPRSGRKMTFPEVDRAEFFSLEEARGKMNAAQVEFLGRLEKLLF